MATLYSLLCIFFGLVDPVTNRQLLHRLSLSLSQQTRSTQPSDPEKGHGDSHGSIHCLKQQISRAEATFHFRAGTSSVSSSCTTHHAGKSPVMTCFESYICMCVCCVRSDLTKIICSRSYAHQIIICLLGGGYIYIYEILVTASARASRKLIRRELMI
jgi:hypothetical protein